jgi:hypothetical protein
MHFFSGRLGATGFVFGHPSFPHLTPRESGYLSQYSSILGRVDILFFAIASSPAHRPTQPAIHCGYWGQSCRGVKLSAHLHLMSKLRKRDLNLQSFTVLEMGRYMPVYHTGTSFVPEFHTGTYHYMKSCQLD